MAAADQNHRHDLNPSKPNKRKKVCQNPETNLTINLNACSKSKDLRAAIALYDAAVSQNLRLGQQHLQTLLYLCAASATDPSLKPLAVDQGFRIFNHMVSSLKIDPNEASVTAAARLASAKGDGDYAFELVKDMVARGREASQPRLRTYAPALFCFCEGCEAEKAYEVVEHMCQKGVVLEEAEIAALLKVSAVTDRPNMVYKYLHLLRDSVRCVSEETSEIIERWFHSDNASETGEINLDLGLIREAILKKGGGWHGLGWIGEGNWVVMRGNVEPTGLCTSCGDRLACVDIGEKETEEFAEKVAKLAMEREDKDKSKAKGANFREFQEWLERNGNYEAIVDGANIGLYQQNFADGGFSVPQLEAVVKELYSRSDNKWPLIFLHTKRVRALLEDFSCRKLVEEWINNGILYTTPVGSNDDWYWLYAAVKLKCLLVTNDEMRDHIFELLGSSFIQKWKERHQVRYTFVKGSLKLQMPPPYSAVIQESEKGSWHVPIVCNTDDDSARTWLCITRPGAHSSELRIKPEIFGNCQNLQSSNKPHGLCRFENVTCNNRTHLSQDHNQDSNNGGTGTIGKRKEMYPSKHEALE